MLPDEGSGPVWRRERREIFRIVGWGGAAGVGNIPRIPQPASGHTSTRSRPLIGHQHPVLASDWSRDHKASAP